MIPKDLVQLVAFGVSPRTAVITLDDALAFTTDSDSTDLEVTASISLQSVADDSWFEYTEASAIEINWWFNLGEKFDNDEMIVDLGNTAKVELTGTSLDGIAYDAVKVSMTISNYRAPPSLLPLVDQWEGSIRTSSNEDGSYSPGTVTYSSEKVSPFTTATESDALWTDTAAVPADDGDGNASNAVATLTLGQNNLDYSDSQYTFEITLLSPIPSKGDSDTSHSWMIIKCSDSNVIDVTASDIQIVCSSGCDDGYGGAITIQLDPDDGVTNVLRVEDVFVENLYRDDVLSFRLEGLKTPASYTTTDGDGVQTTPFTWTINTYWSEETDYTDSYQIDSYTPMNCELKAPQETFELQNFQSHCKSRVDF